MVALVVRSAGALVTLTGSQLPAAATSGAEAPLVRLLEFGLGLCAALGVLAFITLTIGNAFVTALLGRER